MRAIAALSFALLAAPLTAQIAIPRYVTKYTATRARGTFFTAPTSFVITAVQVPDESKLGMQSVAIYKMASAPPAYSGTVAGTPVFFKSKVASSQYIPVIPPIVVQKGEIVVALGVCHTATGTTYTSSYGAAKFASSVMGLPITLQRCGTQEDFVGLGGKCKIWSEVAGSNGRVRIFVARHGSAMMYGAASGKGNLPALEPADENPPSVGKVAEMLLKSGTATNLAGVLLMGSGRVNIPIAPFGTLLAGLPFGGTLVVPGPVPTAGKPIQLPIPNNSALIGIKVNWQALMIRAANSFAMTNGLEWVVGT